MLKKTFSNKYLTKIAFSMIALAVLVFNLPTNGSWVAKVFQGIVGEATGRIGKLVVKVNNIDKISPAISAVNLVPSVPTNQNVTVTIMANDEGGSNISGYSFDGGTTRQVGSGKIYTSNSSGVALVIDNAGNTGEAVPFSINNIDKTPPTCDLSYSPSTRTKENVVAKLVNCSETIVEDNQHIFTGNGSYEFVFHDEVGNTGTKTAEVSRIDKTPIIATVTYDPTNIHYEQVKVIFTLNTTGGEAPTGWTKSGNFQYYQIFDGIEEKKTDFSGKIEFINYVGTTGAGLYSLTIDMEHPVCDVVYSTTGYTKNDVVAQLVNCNEEIIGITGHTFTGNGEWLFTFTDILGNTGSTLADVSRIDKMKPTILSIYASTEDPTNQPVILTIQADDNWALATESYSFDGGNTWQSSNNASFTGNGNVNISVRDSVGNISTGNYNISNIDLISPIATSVVYNSTKLYTTGNVIVTISVNEPVILPANSVWLFTGTSFAVTFSENRSGNFEFFDLANNTGSTGLEIKNIINDNDGDIVPDEEEIIDGTDINNRNSYKDSDGDLVPDWIEIQEETDPLNPKSYKDSDGDLVPDYWENYRDGTNPEDVNDYQDSDNDGVPDYIELINGTNPNNSKSYADSDGDEVPDYVESYRDNTNKSLPDLDKTCQISCNIVDNSFKDTDGDGVPDYIEEQDGTESDNPDDYRDDNKNGIPDYVERHTNPPEIENIDKVQAGNNILVSITINKPVEDIPGWTRNDNNTFSKLFTENGTDTIELIDYDGNDPVPADIEVTGVKKLGVPEWVSGNGGSSKDRCPNGDFSPSYYDGTCGLQITANKEHGSANLNDPLAKGLQYLLAYQWAKGIGITSIQTYKEARMTYTITRAEMAKMIVLFLESQSGYVENLSNKDACKKFYDLSDVNAELQYYVTKSCQMGLMGIDASSGGPISILRGFNPKNSISRAEVGTIISRILREGKYENGGEFWYTRHLQALHEAMIMDDITRPNAAELRGNVMLMLMKIGFSSKK